MQTTPSLTDRAAELRTIITRVVRESTGMHETLAVPVAEALTAELQRRFGGQEIPPEPKPDRNQSIRHDWQRGTPIDVLVSQYNVSRATVYRLIGRTASG